MKIYSLKINFYYFSCLLPAIYVQKYFECHCLYHDKPWMFCLCVSLKYMFLFEDMDGMTKSLTTNLVTNCSRKSIFNSQKKKKLAPTNLLLKTFLMRNGFKQSFLQIELHLFRKEVQMKGQLFSETFFLEIGILKWSVIFRPPLFEGLFW